MFPARAQLTKTHSAATADIPPLKNILSENASFVQGEASTEEVRSHVVRSFNGLDGAKRIRGCGLSAPRRLYRTGRVGISGSPNGTRLTLPIGMHLWQLSHDWQ